MKKIFFKLIVGIVLFIPFEINAISTSATTSIMMDMDTKRIIHSKNIHEIRSVASISKIMTAIVAIENADIKSKVTIGDEINKAYGSGIYIKKGEVLTLEDLLYGLMLRSGNDSALAIAKYVGKDVDKFVEMMNKKAKEIGMKNTTFNNPSGLDQEEGNYSTAYDMALLMSYAYQNKDFRKITSTKTYKLTTNKNTYSWTNKNKLLKTYKYTTGGKTGFTEKARRTLVTTASKDNLNLVVVTLNDGDDWNDHKKLFEYGFKHYKNYKILTKGIFNVYDDDYYDKYNLYIKNNFSYTMKENEKENILVKVELNKRRTINNNEKVGVAKVYLGDKEIHEEDIYVKEKNIKKDNFFTKIKNWFKNL